MVFELQDLQHYLGTIKLSTPNRNAPHSWGWFWNQCRFTDRPWKKTRILILKPDLMGRHLSPQTSTLSQALDSNCIFLGNRNNNLWNDKVDIFAQSNCELKIYQKITNIPNPKKTSMARHYFFPFRYPLVCSRNSTEKYCCKLLKTKAWTKISHIPNDIELTVIISFRVQPLNLYTL